MLPASARRRCLQTLALAALPLKSAPQPRLTIRLSHVVAPQTPKGLALERFRENLQAASQGRIQVVIYPNSLLYGDAEEMQALQLGGVDMLAPSLSKFGPIGFPEFELFDLPFLFEARQQVHRVTQGAVGQDLLAGLARQGLVGLGYLDNGFKHMSANRPLREPQDFVGLRMRVQSSRVIAHQMRALGARPVVLAFGETRRALAMGVVDGTENPISNFWTQGMHEVQIDLSLTSHAWLGYAVVAHQRFWDHLPPDDRRLVAGALAEALQWGNAIAQHENDAALAALRESGATRIHTLNEAQRQRLREATREVYVGLQGRIGTGWLERVRTVLKPGRGYLG
ncbi:MAG: DctP family TRAP transporter solute-binding subunit [Giesbergeria sp.]|jgi:C4-dicarboxylate-binding protein DctP|nr:DctP family TRAP transporter solute-binding subunit [Giesbergeria sp.]MBP6159141.1 DctP family TRAP transporter solute-binding subunit [Giesbergeria sp.]MBP6308328.1 DctP family TRAP transporter solute-binding subunit [Burkholderiaceae bacterium]MBP7082944.1 DctP family TRAP transporter solute-binding subunit [Giesbergeria sp.]MBP9785264.1 DctP family TRAP transporter solute-binding subunit [Giesbergeria sp.]